MPNPVANFGINADDVARGRRFYEQVFGWRFQPWGPPNFYLIQTGEDGSAISGLMHERRELVKGTPTIGYECTISVEDIDATIRAIEAAGGTIVMAKFHIPTVGKGVYFTDTEGNAVCAMQYETPR
jgi:predicted enzyme related to lactoylglutathione lyase